MYRFYVNNVENDYHYSELTRVFLPEDSFELIPIKLEASCEYKLRNKSYIINRGGSADRDEIKRELYRLLADITHIEPEWGTLTGVKPLKLALDLIEKYGSMELMRKHLNTDYLVKESKIALISEIAEYQMKYMHSIPYEKLAVYIGIPFCPSRCSYCSFAANVANETEIQKYCDNLLKEIKYMGSLIRLHGDEIESLYIGGGTPTALNPEQLKALIYTIKEELAVIPEKIEFTVESGRPDTITAEKLEVMRSLGISRISINPQSMKDRTMKLIGRAHNAQDIIDAYKLAANYDFDVINADLIAGLPEENLDDFKYSLEKMLSLGANNITVHTLSVKRGSRIREYDPEYYRKNTQIVSDMLSYAHRRLKEEGFYPYYIYRQKHQIGAFENIGYCRDGQHSIYNIRIMEEKQTIIGLGAGAIGKIYYPAEDRLERVANVSNYQIYSERFEEILERKNRYYGG